MRISLFLAFLMFCKIALAGPGDGGGGTGVVCRLPTGEVKSVELLDLWEARNIYKRNIVESNLPVDLQARAAFRELLNSFILIKTGTADFQNQIKNNLDSDADNTMRFAQKFFSPTSNDPSIIWMRNVNLARTADVFEDAQPSDCPIEQIVRYKDNGNSLSTQILVNEDLFDKMSNTQKAALIAHEVFYQRLRETGETDSLRVRRAVGYVFGGGKFTDAQTDLSQQGYKLVAACDDDQSPQIKNEMKYFKPSSGSTDLYIFQIPGQSASGHTYVGVSSFLGGHPTIGYNRMSSVYFGDFSHMKYVSQQSLFEICQQPDKDSKDYTIPGQTNPTLENDPIDFDRQVNTSSNCLKSRDQISLMLRVRGEQVLETKLKCHPVQSAH